MKEADFNELIESVRAAGAIKRGERRASRVYKFKPMDVKKIRESIGLSQTEFSSLIHVSIKTLQNWEQGRRHPHGPALALLRILRKDPTHAIKALH